MFGIGYDDVDGGSDASLLAGTASVVRNRRAVLNGLDVQPGGLQSGDRTFASASRSLDPNIDFLHAHFQGLFRHLLRGALTGKRRTLAASFEATGASTGPAECVTFGVGDRNRRVVERRMDMSDTVADVPSNSLFLVCLCHGKVLYVNVFLMNGLIVQ